MEAVVGQYDARGVPGLADQHAAILGDPGHQLRLCLLVLGCDVRGRLLGAVALHDRQAAAPEAGAAEPGAQDPGGLQEDLVQLYHLFAPAFVVEYGATTRCRDQLPKFLQVPTSPCISALSNPLHFRKVVLSSPGKIFFQYTLQDQIMLELHGKFKKLELKVIITF